MAFAQYYYDPALEFERALDDDNREAPAPTSATLVGNSSSAGSAITTKSTDAMYVPGQSHSIQAQRLMTHAMYP